MSIVNTVAKKEKEYLSSADDMEITTSNGKSRVPLALDIRRQAVASETSKVQGMATTQSDTRDEQN